MEEDLYFSTGMTDVGFGPFLRKLTWENLGFPKSYYRLSARLKI